MHTTKAQGTIEYLIILAVVVIVALVVVSLMVNSTAPSAGISSAAYKIAAQTNPLAITEAIVNPDGDYYLKFENNTGENIIITSIEIGDNNPLTPNKTIPLGGEDSFTIDTEDLCQEG